MMHLETIFNYVFIYLLNETPLTREPPMPWSPCAAAIRVATPPSWLQTTIYFFGVVFIQRACSSKYISGS